VSEAMGLTGKGRATLVGAAEEEDIKAGEDMEGVVAGGVAVVVVMVVAAVMVEGAMIEGAGETAGEDTAGAGTKADIKL
jgi:hypothetical protein